MTKEFILKVINYMKHSVSDVNGMGGVQGRMLPLFKEVIEMHDILEGFEVIKKAHYQILADKHNSIQTLMEQVNDEMMAGALLGKDRVTVEFKEFDHSEEEIEYVLSRLRSEGFKCYVSYFSESSKLWVRLVILVD